MRQEILRCTISIAVELGITPKTRLCNRVSKDAFERLEPCAPKDACTVLRGLGAGNRARLPDPPVSGCSVQSCGISPSLC
jgi:hypothetical protein